MYRVAVPSWALLLLLLTAAGSAAFAAACYRAVRNLSQRGTLRGIRRHLDDQDEVIRGLRRDWAVASEELTRIVEDMSKERGKAQAASARAAKAEKRVSEASGADSPTDLESYRKRALGGIQLGGDE